MVYAIKRANEGEKGKITVIWTTFKVTNFGDIQCHIRNSFLYLYFVINGILIMRCLSSLKNSIHDVRLVETKDYASHYIAAEQTLPLWQWT